MTDEDGQTDFPPDTDSTTPPRDEQIAGIVDAYLDDLNAGRNPDADALLANHPEMSDELRECLDAVHLVHGHASPGDDTSSDDASSDQHARTSSNHPQSIGDFRILSEVGRGGMGVVYEAQQLSLNRRVALKIMRRGIADPDALQRFQREAETVANLQHSNIVPIFEVGEADGLHYFAMQFIEGRSLAELQRDSDGPLDAMDVAEWGLQTAEALSYAHDHDIIHRDVKPSNLIQDEQGRIWLTDFGLAKRLDDVQQSMTGAIVGTPRYMSPEQATSMRRPVDHRTDLYSLGATLYELATGQPLFSADNPHAALGQVIGDDPVPPRVVRPNLPRDLETIILRCLSKQAADRYENANDLANDLRAYMDGQAIQARRPSVYEKTARWIHKQRKTIAACVATIAVTTLITFGVRKTWQHYHKNQIGKIQFLQDDVGTTSMAGEIVNDDHTAVVPSFTIPNQRAIPIPAGSHKLLLRSHGQLSSSYNLSVVPTRRNSELTVGLDHKNQWEPIQHQGEWALWERPNGADILLFDDETLTARDGATSEPLWSVRMTDHQVVADQLQQHQLQWSWVSQGGQRRPRAWIHPSNTDFNGDGVDDLLLSLRHFPNVLLFSGSDGELLWSCASLPNLVATDQALPNLPTQREPKTESPRHAEIAAVLYQPILCNVNEDDIPDIVATIAARDNAASVHTCVVAISGASGKQLWKYQPDIPQATSFPPLPNLPFAAKWFPELPELLEGNFYERWGDHVTRTDNGSGTAKGQVVAYPPERVTLDHHQQLHLVAGQQQVRIDLKTGQERSNVDIGFVPVSPPQLLPSREEADSPAVLLCEQIGVDSAPQLRISCRDLKSQEQRWSRDVKAVWGYCANDTDKRPKWPLLADLDGDGQREIIVPGNSNMDMPNFELVPSGSLQVIDSVTGEFRWAHPSSVVHSEHQINHFCVADDLDGDNIRDVATISFFSGPHDNVRTLGGRTAFVYVDVLSGVDGKRIFWMRSPKITLERSLGRVPKIESVELLGDVVSVGIESRPWDRREGGCTVCFSLAQRKALFVADDLLQPQLSDLDDDGVLEFIAWNPTEGRRFTASGQLKAFQTVIPTHGQSGNWSYANDSFKPVGDVNGDGVEDLVSAWGMRSHRETHLAHLVSGATGERLWKQELDSTESGYAVNPLNLDINGDGAPDILFSDIRFTASKKSPLSARCGRTGKLLWQYEVTGTTNWIEDWVLSIEDLDGDQRPELIMVVKANPNTWVPAGPGFDGPMSILCLDAQTGIKIWETPTTPLSQPKKLELRNYQAQFADVDRDGIKDVLGYVATDQAELVLAAFNGSNGTRIWQTDPRAMTADNGPPSFVVLDTFSSKRPKGSTPCVVVMDYGSKLSVQAIDTETGMPRWTWETETNGWSLARRYSLEGQDYGSTTPTVFRTRHGNALGFWFTDRHGDPEFILLQPDEASATTLNRIKIASWKRAEDSADSSSGPSTDSSSVASSVDRSPEAKRQIQETNHKKMHREYLSGLRIFSADIDGDAMDELIYTTPTEVVVRRPDEGEPRWTWKIPTFNHEPTVAVIKSVQLDTNGRPMFAVAFGPSRNKLPNITWLNCNGEPIWNASFPAENLTQCQLVNATQNMPPRVLTMQSKRTSTHCIAARRPKLHAASAKTIPYLSNQSETPDDPRLYRVPPWNVNDRFLVTGLQGAWLSAVLYCLPLLYLRSLTRGRWSMKTLFAAPAIVALWIIVVQTPFESEGPDMEPVQQNLLFGLMMVPVMAVGATAFNLLRRFAWQRLAKTALVLTAVAFGIALWMLWMVRFFEETESVRLLWTWAAVPGPFVFATWLIGLLTLLWTAGRYLFLTVCNLRLYKKDSLETS